MSHPVVTEAPVVQVPVTQAPVAAPVEQPAATPATTPASTPTPAPGPRLSFREQVFADIQNKLSAYESVPGTPAQTPVQTQAPAVTPTQVPGTETPAPASTAPAPATFDPSVIDNFTLDLDADPTLNDSGQTPTQTPASTPDQPAASEATASTTSVAPPEGETIPVTFTPEEQAVIKKYLETPGSTNIRQQAKIVRELAKHPNNGGLGYTPTSTEIIEQFQRAAELDAMNADYASSDDVSAHRWAAHWLYELGRDEQGRVVVKRDHTGMPAIRTGAQKAVSALSEAVVRHPQLLETVVNQLPTAIDQAVQAQLPGAQQAREQLATRFYTELYEKYEAIIPQLTGKVLEFEGVDGKPVKVKADSYMTTLLGHISQDFGVKPKNAQQPTPVNPEVEELRRRLEAIEGNKTKTQQVERENYVRAAEASINSRIVTSLDKDLDARLQPLKQILEQSAPSLQDAQTEYNLLKEGLRQQLTNELRTNPAFTGRYAHTLKAIRSGIGDPTQLGNGLVRTVRELYSGALRDRGASLIRNRMNQVAAKVTQQHQTMQGQQTAVQPAGGQPLQQHQVPGAVSNAVTNGGASGLPPMKPNESVREWTMRAAMEKLQKAGGQG